MENTFDKVTEVRSDSGLQKFQRIESIKRETESNLENQYTCLKAKYCHFLF